MACGKTRRRPSGPLPSAIAAALLLPLLAACAEDDAGAVIDEPGRLKGRSEADLRAIFGEPPMLRRDGPARVWQYAVEGCFLDLFLYEEKEGSGVSVLVRHFEIRNRGEHSPSTRACLSAIVAAKR